MRCEVLKYPAAREYSDESMNCRIRHFAPVGSNGSDAGLSTGNGEGDGAGGTSAVAFTPAFALAFADAAGAEDIARRPMPALIGIGIGIHRGSRIVTGIVRPHPFGRRTIARRIAAAPEADNAVDQRNAIVEHEPRRALPEAHIRAKSG
jgi:hypothetical protein